VVSAEHWALGIGHWWQQPWFSGPDPVFVDLSILDTSAQSPPTVIDNKTAARTNPRSLHGLPANNTFIVTQDKLFKLANVANKNRTDSWRKMIDQIKKNP
jgi:hypothetical protein